ncbi:hypothetical protein EGW08_020680 [Elysia chlorotica]|uniref:Uncharacterized protein n=1 Tax=Elysia chlorotica TaxID=188477 RepID=A0A3S1B484_ELYCH|nr:hypothetical protein EGW08_020680 [Elysia chlorotica]
MGYEPKGLRVAGYTIAVSTNQLKQFLARVIRTLHPRLDTQLQYPLNRLKQFLARGSELYTLGWIHYYILGEGIRTLHPRLDTQLQYPLNRLKQFLARGSHEVIRTLHPRSSGTCKVGRAGGNHLHIIVRYIDGMELIKETAEAFKAVEMEEAEANTQKPLLKGKKYFHSGHVQTMQDQKDSRACKATDIEIMATEDRTSTPQTNSSQIVIIPQLERSVRRFDGDQGHQDLERFLEDVESAWAQRPGQTDQERAAYLWSHLGSNVRDELYCQGVGRGIRLSCWRLCERRMETGGL